MAVRRIIVIGGGFSGLAVSALLAKAGYKVQLLEKNKELGGRARVLKKKGFSFDMGPSWYLMPEVFEKFFGLFEKKVSDYYELVRLDPRYKVFYGDEKEGMVLKDDLKQNEAVFEQIEKGSGKKLRQFLDKTKEVYELTTQGLVYQDVFNLKAWVRGENVKQVLKLITSFNFWQSWDSWLKGFFKSDKLRKILGFPAVFLGGSPFNTPALYSILAWADFGEGVWYPRGGMGKVVEGLEELAKEMGVEVITGVEVKKLLVKKGKVWGVRTERELIRAEAVVAATDVPMVELKLLPKKYQKEESNWSKKTIGISALLLYLGVKKRIENLVHHNIYFARDWEKNFREIFEAKTIPEDPSFYISARSATDRTIVPEGMEELFVLVPLGSGGQYSQVDLKKLKAGVIKKMEKMLGEKIEEYLTVEEQFTPADFERDYRAYKGTALGLAHTLNQSLWGRAESRSQKIKGLYFTGQYTNPGVGVPMALISAQITAEALIETDKTKEKIFKRGSVTYYYSSLFFKGQVKKDVFSLYAYVRQMDDLVDCEKPKIKDLEQMWQETKYEWQGKGGGSVVVKGMIELAKRKGFEWSWIEAFYRAMAADLKIKEYKSFEQLEEYMYGSAEVIGLMMAKILDLPEEAMMAAAKQGKAMQYVNFIRDVKEDEMMGRNYIGYGREIKEDQKKWVVFVAKAIDRYRKIQEEAEKGYKFIPKAYLVPIKTAAEMYNWTAKMIEDSPEVVWQKKIKPSKLQVLTTIVKNWLTLR